MTVQFTDEQVMLCFAGLTYQGFSDGTAGRFHTEAGRQTILQGLRRLKPLDDGWELVWGPVSYRAPLSFLDDELMYVVHKPGDDRDRYVVAIRGTNPISAFDWVFGDLWAARQMPWPYDETKNAKISLSTALGLAILKGMRSAGPRQDASASVLRDVVSRLRVIGGEVTGIAGELLGTVMTNVAGLRKNVTGILDDFARLRAQYQATDANSHFLELAKLWQSDATIKLLSLVDEATGLSKGRIDLAVLALLEDEARFRGSLGSGVDLQTFLTAAVKAAEGRDVDVVVTGHSKGGGLASTVALWLEQIRRGGHDAWDPDGHATVHCYSYAGPTAGNAAFAKLSNEKIGPRCHRIANSRDVVPHAWFVDDLLQIARLYDTDVPRIPALAPLANVIAGFTRDLGYTQIDTVATFEGNYEGAPLLFLPQFVHQHMDAYLEHFDLIGPGITTQTLFDPLALLR